MSPSQDPSFGSKLNCNWLACQLYQHGLAQLGIVVLPRTSSGMLRFCCMRAIGDIFHVLRNRWLSIFNEFKWLSTMSRLDAATHGVRICARRLWFDPRSEIVVWTMRLTHSTPVSNTPYPPVTPAPHLLFYMAITFCMGQVGFLPSKTPRNPCI